MALVYDRFLRQRLTRRRLLGAAGGTALGAAGVALVGCGSGGGKPGNGSTPGANETPTVGGIYRTRQTNVIPSVSPFGLTALISTLIFGFTTYDHLWYVPIDTGNASEGLLALKDGKWIVLRVPYPLGFYSKWMDGRIDNPSGGWKGRGLYATVSTRAPFHMETGKGSTSKVMHFQMRPNPLAK